MSDTIRATPTDKRITHDLELTDGLTRLGLILCNSKGIPIQGGNPWTLRQSGSTRTSLQINTGDPDYSNYQLPYTPFTQKDWSGGRGNEDFEDDKTRYYDSLAMDTRMGDIILSGKPTETAIQLNSTSIEPIENDSTIIRESTSASKYASPFTATETAIFNTISLLVEPGDTCTVQVIADDTGAPSTHPEDIVASATVNAPALTISVSSWGAELGGAMLGANELGHGVNVANDLDVVLVEIPISGSYSSGSTYWVVVDTDVIGYNALTDIAVFDDDGGWDSLHADNCIYFKIESVIQGIVRYFDYKGALYAAVTQDNGLQSSLFINGYRFTAGSGSNQLQIVSGATYVANELVGCTLQVVAGKCYSEHPNYRTIVSNSETTIYLDSGFLNTPDNTTDIVILGRDLWTEITGTGIANGITAICVANEQVYFAQGESVNIRKMREYNNSGTWTRAFADEGTSKATFLASFPNHQGMEKIWKFNNPSSGAPTAAYATPVAWGNNMDFTTKPTELAATTTYPIPIGDPRSKITSVVGYGDPIIPHVFKEDEFGSISEGIYAKYPISELAQVKSATNGSTSIQFGVYLFFNVLDGWQRFYQNRLDDIGPNRDEGLPEGRRGLISCAVSYPGGMYLGIDAGVEGYSSAMYWNQTGYHEVYRAPYGERIRSLFVQTIPGKAVGRLWIGLSDTTIWIPVTLNPRKHEDYRYASTGNLTSSWFNGGFREINKFWKSIQLYGEDLTATENVTIEYQTDMEDDWRALPTAFTTTPMQEVLMESDYSVHGKRWRYRITMVTGSDTKSPRIKAITIPSVTRLPNNKAWSITVLADDAMVDRQGKQQALTAKQLMDQLQTWADSAYTPVPITLRSPVSAFDNKRVFIEPPTIQPIEVVNGEGNKLLKAICTFSMYEA